MNDIEKRFAIRGVHGVEILRRDEGVGRFVAGFVRFADNAAALDAPTGQQR